MSSSCCVALWLAFAFAIRPYIELARHTARIAHETSFGEETCQCVLWIRVMCITRQIWRGRCFFCTHRSNPRSSMSCNRDRNVLRFTQPSNLSQPFFFPRLNESLSNKFVVSSTMFVNVTASLRFFAAARRAETCVSNDSSTLLLSTQSFPIDSIN